MDKSNLYSEKEKLTKNVRGNVYVDTLIEETAINNCRGDFNHLLFEKNITKSNNAITLVTLIITIIIMLIIAGVTTSIITDENDVFEMAEDATAQWNNKITTEDNAMQNLLAKRNEILGGTAIEPTNPPPETPPAQSSITLNKSSIELEIVDGVNAQETLVATKQNLTGTITWTSSVPTVATVDSNGKVTTAGEGQTTITASCEGYSAACTVTVITRISVDKIAPAFSITNTVVQGQNISIEGTILNVSAIDYPITVKYYCEGIDDAGGNISEENEQTIEEGINVSVSLRTNPGNYTLTFEVIDKTGNVSEQVTTTVTTTCFVAGTKVLTEHGLINIENVEFGMKVYSQNMITGEIELKEVKNTFEHIVKKEIYRIYVNGEKIESTSEHPFYVVNKGWVIAEKLEKGDMLLNKKGERLEIENIEIMQSESDIIVYNFEVKDNHNYFVGENMMLVHNKIWS